MSYQKDPVFHVSVKRNLPISKIAERFGWSGAKLNNVLVEYGVIYKDEKTNSWYLSDQYKDKGYAVLENVVCRSGSIEKKYLKWTYDGRKFICQLLKDEFELLPDTKEDKTYYKQNPVAQKIEDADGCITISSFAHVLAANNILVNGSAPHHSNVYNTLRNNGFLNNKRGFYWNLPYPEFDCFGYFKISELISQDGKKRYFPKLTPKGQAFFLRYFKKLMDENRKEE